MRSATLTLTPLLKLSTKWWKWATPKNSGVINIAVKGVKHCNKSGSIQALNVHSSERGATI